MTSGDSSARLIGGNLASELVEQATLYVHELIDAHMESQSTSEEQYEKFAPRIVNTNEIIFLFGWDKHIRLTVEEVVPDD